jgi:hypothetical protein
MDRRARIDRLICSAGSGTESDHRTITRRTFLVSEVHLFTDGNGRIARAMMNAELVAGQQSKIIVPAGFRSDYLSALRRLSRDDDPSVCIKALRFLHDYTGSGVPGQLARPAISRDLVRHAQQVIR